MHGPQCSHLFFDWLWRAQANLQSSLESTKQLSVWNEIVVTVNTHLKLPKTPSDPWSTYWPISTGSSSLSSHAETPFSGPVSYSWSLRFCQGLKPRSTACKAFAPLLRFSISSFAEINNMLEESMVCTIQAIPLGNYCPCPSSHWGMLFTSLQCSGTRIALFPHSGLAFKRPLFQTLCYETCACQKLKWMQDLGVAS